MAAEAKREPGLLRRWLQKLRESWRRAGAINQRVDKAHRTDENKYGSFGGGSR
jgi:hypothetical protein